MCVNYFILNVISLLELSKYIYKAALNELLKRQQMNAVLTN